MRPSQHDAASAPPYRDRILAPWPSVVEPVADEEGGRTRFCEQHRGRADFRLIAAEQDDELLGFAWGYVGVSGQWRADMVHEALGTDTGDRVGGHSPEKVVMGTRLPA